MLPKNQRLNLKLESNRVVFGGEKFFAPSRAFVAYFDFKGQTGKAQVAVNISKKEVALAVERNAVKRKIWAQVDVLFQELLADFPTLRLIFQGRKLGVGVSSTALKADFAALEKKVRNQ